MPAAVDLIQLGAVGVFAFVVWQELHAMRLEAREDRKAEAEDRDRIGAWLVAIHSRLGSLGADSIAPPIVAARTRKTRSEPRQRVDTPPPILGRASTVPAHVAEPHDPDSTP